MRNIILICFLLATATVVQWIMHAPQANAEQLSPARIGSVTRAARRICRRRFPDTIKKKRRCIRRIKQRRDPDSDERSRRRDNCPTVYNVDQIDSDGDSVGDACDNCVSDANPAQDDSNDDGIGNVCQQTLDIAAGDSAADEVYILYDALNADSVSTPDVVLTHAAINGPRALVIYNNRLFVGSEDGETIAIYNNFTSLTSSSSPDVVLDNPNSQIGAVFDIIVSNDDLYVSNQRDNRILIFRDVDTLVTNQAPDVVLTNLVDDSKGIVVDQNTLFAANEDDRTISVYKNASGLTTGAAPDIQLDAANSQIGFCPSRVYVDFNTLFVSDSCNSRILGFRDPHALIGNDTPSFVLFGEGGAFGLSSINSILFTSRKNDPAAALPLSPDPVVGYSNAETLQSGATPDIVLSDSLSGSETLLAGPDSLWVADETGNVLGYFNAAEIKTSDQPSLLLFSTNSTSITGLALSTR